MVHLAFARTRLSAQELDNPQRHQASEYLNWCAECCQASWLRIGCDFSWKQSRAAKDWRDVSILSARAVQLDYWEVLRHDSWYLGSGDNALCDGVFHNPLHSPGTLRPSWNDCKAAGHLSRKPPDQQFTQIIILEDLRKGSSEKDYNGVVARTWVCNWREGACHREEGGGCKGHSSRYSKCSDSFQNSDFREVSD